MSRLKWRRSYTPLVTVLLVLGDILTLGLAFAAAYWFRFYAGLIEVSKGIPPADQYVWAFPIVALVFVYVFKTSHLYRTRQGFSIFSEIGKVVRAVSLAFFILMALNFLYRGDVPFSRAFVLIAWAFSILFLAIHRGISNQVELWIRKQKKQGKKVLILGTGEASQRLIRGIENNPRLEYDILGIVAIDLKHDSSFAGKPVLGHISNFSELVQKTKAEMVILAVGNIEHKEIVQLMLLCEKNLVQFHLVPDMFEILTTQFNVSHISGIPLLGLKEIPLVNIWNRFQKRTLDILSSAFGLVIASPFLLVIALMVKLSSKGPIFYSQERCGEDGRTFQLYKFRTMKIDAEKESGPVWAAEEDPRRTKIGSFLRRWNLDELPQLWNVLKGDMSLVGPRPERPYFVNQFKEDIPRYMSRHLVRSGITGWAQINGLRGNTDIRQRIEYDLYYMENWSLLFDIKIILLTLFRGTLNAY